MMKVIEKIELFHVDQPLTVPYHLSYGDVNDLSSLWVHIVLSDGGEGWGECTPLPGYSDSDLKAVTEYGQYLAKQWIGKIVDVCLNRRFPQIDGFLYSALYSALEEACGLISPIEGAIPLVALVQEAKGESIREVISAVRQQGYRVFKMKVGFQSVEEDRKRIEIYQGELQADELLRIDANQGLALDDAYHLVEVCSPEKVEVFEQPYKIEMWEESAKLQQQSAVPIMLDESITDLASVQKTIDLQAAGAVKLKLMKQGGFSRLKEMVQAADAAGLKVIFGNGVAGAVNNRHEAIFWLRELKQFGLAGELNGFIKVQNPIGTDFIRFESGQALVTNRGGNSWEEILRELNAAQIEWQI